MDYGIGGFPTIGDSPGAFADSHNFTLTKQADADEDRGQAARVFICLDERELREPGRAREHPRPGHARSRTRRSPTAGRPMLATDEVLDSFLFLQQVPGYREIAADSYQRAVQPGPSSATKSRSGALEAAVKTAQEMLDRNRDLYGFLTVIAERRHEEAARPS